MRIIVLLPISLMLVACSTKGRMTTTSKDSTRIEIREHVSYIRDTVTVTLPPQMAERTTRDSVSHLETRYAVSDARINADGSLYHDLRTLDKGIPVPVDKMITRHDSIIYRDRLTEIPVEVKRKLTWWQHFRLDAFGWLVGAVAVLVVWLFRRQLLYLARTFFKS